MRRVFSRTVTGQEVADLLMTGVLVTRAHGAPHERRQLYVTVAHDVDSQITVIRDVGTGIESVFDAPLVAVELEDALGGGLCWEQTGDTIDRFGEFLVFSEMRHVAADDGLAGSFIEICLCASSASQPLEHFLRAGFSSFANGVEAPSSADDGTHGNRKNDESVMTDSPWHAGVWDQQGFVE